MPSGCPAPDSRSESASPCSRWHSGAKSGRDVELSRGDNSGGPRSPDSAFELGEHKVSPTRIVIARINDRCQPLDRGAIYEDPLNEALEAQGFGTVTGGGTQLGPNREIAWCDIEISLASEQPNAVDFVMDGLNRLGAPKGSKLMLGAGEEIAFGLNEGMALYFDNVNLPAEVYEQYDINDLIEQFHAVLNGSGCMHSASNGATETRAYFYGPSFAAMKSALSDLFATHPLCQGLRVEQCA